MANVMSMTVKQAYTMVEQLYSAATGEASISVVDTASFTSVAEATMRTGTNKVISALAEVLSTIRFAARPYSGKFKILWMDADSFGNHVEKISYIDNADAVTNPAWEIADSQQIGVYTVKLPKIWVGNYYGQNTISAYITIAERQLRTAFQSASQLANFFTGLMTNISNQIEQQKEAIARSCVLNFIGAKNALATKYASEADNHVIHLLTEYNDRYDKNYTNIAECRAVAVDYRQFVEYVFSRIESLGKMMSERSEKYHLNPTAGSIKRFTDASDMKMLLNAQYLMEIGTQVMTGIYNTEYMKLAQHEEVNFWQSIETPEGVQVNPAYIEKDGEAKVAGEQTIANVFGVMFDKDALGIGQTDTFHGTTVMDPDKRAYNEYWKIDWRSYNDMTENGLVLLFD